MTWYDANFKDRYPVAINVIGGSESAGTEDVEIVVPKDHVLLTDACRQHTTFGAHLE